MAQDFMGQSGRALAAAVEFELKSVTIRLLGDIIKFSLHAY